MTPTIRRAVTATAGLAAALALSACGSSDDSGGMDHSGMGGMGSSSTASATTAQTAVHNQADVTFATNMIPHHQQAVEMADLALKQASSAEVTSLATDVKAAQDPEIRTMSGWLTSWGQPVPTPMAGHDMSSMDGMDGMMSAQEMKDLASASGTDFDRMWLRMMTKHHEGAVAMAKTEQAEGKSAEAKDLAGRIIAAQTEEIATMAKLLGSMTG